MGDRSVTWRVVYLVWGLLGGVLHAHEVFSNLLSQPVVEPIIELSKLNPSRNISTYERIILLSKTVWFVGTVYRDVSEMFCKELVIVENTGPLSPLYQFGAVNCILITEKFIFMHGFTLWNLWYHDHTSLFVGILSCIWKTKLPLFQEVFQCVNSKPYTFYLFQCYIWSYHISFVTWQNMDNET